MSLLNSTLAQHFFNLGSGATLIHYLKTMAAKRQSPDGSSGREAVGLASA
jgi:hypothetical protein